MRTGCSGVWLSVELAMGSAYRVHIHKVHNWVLPCIYTKRMVDPMNTTPDPTVYADPFPGLRGDELVKQPCSKCGGDGKYNAPSGYKWVHDGAEDTWCFACMGKGGSMVKVSSVRDRVRKAANRAKVSADAAPLREWLTAEAVWGSEVRAWLKAEKETARQSKLVTGFVGAVAAKVTNLIGTVTITKDYPTEDHFGHSKTGMMLIITLDNGQVVKWSSTARGIWGFEEGARVRIVRAIVKGHGDYRGQEQTELKNVKLELHSTEADA